VKIGHLCDVEDLRRDAKLLDECSADNFRGRSGRRRRRRGWSGVKHDALAFEVKFAPVAAHGGISESRSEILGEGGEQAGRGLNLKSLEHVPDYGGGELISLGDDKRRSTIGMKSKSCQHSLKSLSDGCSGNFDR
jgi:hypothetical protein